MNETIKLLLNHRSIREFNEKKIPDEIRDSIIHCAQMAPTSSFFQAYSIINIIDPQKREALAIAAGNQTWIMKAPLALLFCADLHRNNTWYTVEDKNILHNTESYTVAIVDAALAAQKGLIAAQSYGLGGIIVGGVRNDMQLMRELFQLPELVMPLFVMCLGYYDQAPIQKPRLPIDVVFKTDYYNTENEAEHIGTYNKEVSDYFLASSGGQNKWTWVETCSYNLSIKPRYEVTDFVKQAGFMKK